MGGHITQGSCSSFLRMGSIQFSDSEDLEGLSGSWSHFLSHVLQPWEEPCCYSSCPALQTEEHRAMIHPQAAGSGGFQTLTCAKVIVLRT